MKHFDNLRLTCTRDLMPPSRKYFASSHYIYNKIVFLYSYKNIRLNIQTTFTWACIYVRDIFPTFYGMRINYYYNE